MIDILKAEVLYMNSSEGFNDLIVYRKAYDLAMEIYVITRSFPKEEQYAITDQIRRSSRSVCANFAEGYRKRTYLKSFIAKLHDADAECSETMVWLQFARSCALLRDKQFEKLNEGYKEVGKLLGFMIKNPKEFVR
jgi:four helix bundle protein